MRNQSTDAVVPTHLSDGTVIDKSVVKRLASQFGLSLVDAAAPEAVLEAVSFMAALYEANSMSNVAKILREWLKS